MYLRICLAVSLSDFKFQWLNSESDESDEYHNLINIMQKFYYGFCYFFFHDLIQRNNKCNL